MATLEPFGEELWLARTPLRFLGLPIGRVMTVARLRAGALWVHSAAPLDDELRRELKDLGEVRWVVAPNRLHGHVSMGQYKTAFPHARLVAGPGLPERRRDLTFDAVLGDEIDPAWAGALDQLTFAGHRWLPEVLFHHRPSRTLVTGDACWNVDGASGRPSANVMSAAAASSPPMSPSENAANERRRVFSFSSWRTWSRNGMSAALPRRPSASTAAAIETRAMVPSASPVGARKTDFAGLRGQEGSFSSAGLRWQTSSAVTASTRVTFSISLTSTHASSSSALPRMVAGP